MTSWARKNELFGLWENIFRQIPSQSVSTSSVEKPMAKPEFNVLLLGLAAGDQQAFELLYEQFGGQLYGAAYRMLLRREDAEDVVQEVFVSLARSQQRLGEIRDLSAYLFTALRRAAGKCAQKRERFITAGDLAEHVADPATKQSSPEHFAAERLQRGLAALPAEQREIIALKIEGELTFDQIAQVVKISANTAASRYRYALEKLRRSLQQEQTE